MPLPPVPAGTTFNFLNYPSLWPALMFPAFLLGGWIAARRAGMRLTPWLLPTGGILCLAIYAWCVVNYLCSVRFVDFYEPREASVAWVLIRGGAAYTGNLTEERYSGPYGPVLYLVLGVFQSMFGPSVFSTKLPCAVAGLLSVAGFWTVARRLGASWRQATFLAGAEAAMLLALRCVSYWAKADPFILLLVTAGIHCALGRRLFWQIALGVCAGLAVNLKLHALAYFLPVGVIALHTGWPRLASARVVGAGMVTGLLPFVLAPQHFSLANYLGFLRVTAHEGFGATEAFGFCRWLVMLAALGWVGDRFCVPRPSSTPWEHALRRAFRATLAVGAVLVAVPGCAVGAGQLHLMPLIPLFLLAPGDRFAGMGPAVGLARPPHFAWKAAVGAGLAACLLVSVQTAWRTYRQRVVGIGVARACQVEVQRFALEHGDWTILVASGDGNDDLSTDFRHEVVFAGHPIGIDAAAIMDYQRGGVREPDLGSLVKEMQARTGRPVAWIVPRGDEPFTDRNVYDPRRPAHSEAFRQAFLGQYERREGGGEFFDLYLARDDRFAAACPEAKRHSVMMSLYVPPAGIIGKTCSV